MDQRIFAASSSLCGWFSSRLDNAKKQQQAKRAVEERMHRAINNILPKSLQWIQVHQINQDSRKKFTHKIYLRIRAQSVRRIMGYSISRLEIHSLILRDIAHRHTHTHILGPLYPHGQDASDILATPFQPMNAIVFSRCIPESNQATHTHSPELEHIAAQTKRQDLCDLFICSLILEQESQTNRQWMGERASDVLVCK